MSRRVSCASVLAPVILIALGGCAITPSPLTTEEVGAIAADKLARVTRDQEPISGGVRQQFQNGFVIAPTGGAGAVLSGEIAAYWGTGSNASRLGSPISSPSAWTAGGISGTLQTFQRGTVLSSTTSGTFAVLDGPVRGAWSAQGGSGTIGWPTRRSNA